MTLLEAIVELTAVGRQFLRLQDGPPRGLGPCDLISVEEACRVMEMRDAAGEKWLEANGLIQWRDGRRRVCAGDLARTHDTRKRSRKAPHKSANSGVVANMRSRLKSGSAA